VDRLLQQDDRGVLFVVDRKGGRGKSALARHLLGGGSGKKAWGCQGGKATDLMYSYDTKAEIVVFDFARCNDADYWPWNFIENLKNGWFTSTKYAGRMQSFVAPKIIVMTNQDVNMEKLSKDRYDVFDLDQFFIDE